MQRKPYLEDIPLEEAVEKLFTALEKTGYLRLSPPEPVPLDQALGRITAQAVWARSSSPHYHSAAMDGAAVRAEETRGASKTFPIRLRLPEQAHWVNTGDPLPKQFNAVIMIEDIQQVEEDQIEIIASVAPWQHVRALGEDIVATELVLPENHQIRPQDLGAMAGAGLTEVAVRSKPRVAIIPTGSELIPVGAPLGAGKIIESNSLVLAAQIQQWGGCPVRFPIVPDDYERIRETVEEALKSHDVVIVNAGSSAGAQDFTAAVVSRLGELLVHGVAIRPGHPVVLGVAQGKPVIGIPGYPVSSILTMELFVMPLLHRVLGLALPQRLRVKAIMTRKVLSPLGQEEFLRVKLGKVGERLVATPLTRGAGIIMSQVRADGIVRIPRFSEGIHAGDRVDVELMRARDEVERTIVAIGSHDLALDLLASWLHREHPETSLASANVGSLGGLMALKRGESHLAGSHLLDEATGEYNWPYVRNVLGPQDIVLVNLAYREQGLMVVKGNPKGIQGLKDLLRDDVTFINRQKGSGTRVLLDYTLKQITAGPDSIKGYQREEFTHTAVAAAVASGTADVGLGILAAARALGLDFVPILKERYDLVIPRAFYESPLLKPLLILLRSPAFWKELAGLGGYDTSRTGQEMAEGAW